METSDGYTCVIHRAKNTPNFPDHAAFPGGFGEPRNVLRKVCDKINETHKEISKKGGGGGGGENNDENNVNDNQEGKNINKENQESLARLCSFPRIEQSFMTEILRELWSVREMTEEIGVKAKQRSPTGIDKLTPTSATTPMSVNTITDSKFIVEAEPRCLGLVLRADYMPLVIMHVG
jgi:hypothetical protein